MEKKAIIVIVLIILGIIFLIGCTNNPIDNNLINPPQFVIMSQSKRDVLEGANRVAYVDVTVKNNGGSGSKTIYAQVTQGSNYWIQEQTIRLDNGASTSLSFRFPQVEFFTFDSWNFNVGIR